LLILFDSLYYSLHASQNWGPYINITATQAQEVLTGSPGSGFIALSGGYGTLEELMEVVTWNQLGIHSRGVVVYNVEGYWDGLLEWVRNSVRAGFVGEGTKGIIKEARTAEDAVRELRGYKAEEGRFKLEWGNQ
jgi:uncharacterized protein (TIGR00730 family)